MNESAQVLEEYKSLREELLQNRRFQLQITFSSIVLASSVWSFLVGTKISTSWPFLIPMPILLCNLFLIMDRSKSTDRIITYLQIFYDDVWEKALDKFGEKEFIRKAHFLLITCRIHSFLYAISILFAIWRCNDFYSITFISIFLAVGIGVFKVFYNDIKNIGKRKENYRTHWKEIKEEEKK